MSDLRLALIILGAVFLAAVLFWGRRTTRAKGQTPPPEVAPPPVSRDSARLRRIEPGIEDFSAGEVNSATALGMPVIHAVEPMRLEVMREVAVDIPGTVSEPAMPTILWPPPQTERVLTLRIVRGDGLSIAGRSLRLAIESEGMIHGPQRIYHRVDASGWVRASAANLVRPGSLDPEQMDAQEFRGLSLFCVLPGPVSALQMFDELMQLARRIAARAEAEIQTEQGTLLEGESLRCLRESLLPKVSGNTPT